MEHLTKLNSQTKSFFFCIDNDVVVCENEFFSLDEYIFVTNLIFVWIKTQVYSTPIKLKM